MGGGHEDLFVCPDGSSSTQECLEANPLEYIDSKHGAPRDVKYPGRGYYSNEVEFEMRYKLPMGVTGDRVMLQWRYVTGNSCMSPGYCCHDDDDYFDLYQNVSSWKRANAALCTYPIGPDWGDRNRKTGIVLELCKNNDFAKQRSTNDSSWSFSNFSTCSKSYLSPRSGSYS